MTTIKINKSALTLRINYRQLALHPLCQDSLEAVMVNNYIIINKTNNHLTPQIIE